MSSSLSNTSLLQWLGADSWRCGRLDGEPDGAVAGVSTNFIQQTAAISLAIAAWCFPSDELEVVTQKNGGRKLGTMYTDSCCRDEKRCFTSPTTVVVI